MQTVTPEADGLTTLILTIVMLVLCWPTLLARFAIRHKIGALGLDDWLMGLGLLMTTAWSGILIAYVYSGGGYSPNDPRITPELLANALKLYFICQSFYCPTTIPIKVSICVALLRISGTHNAYKWAIYAIMGISVVAGIGSMIGIVVSCLPPSAFWDPSAGTCNALVNTTAAYFISACGILTDFGLATLPAFMLWNVQLQRSIKVSIAIILGFAAFASCATIVRLRYLLALMDSQNFLQESGQISIWTVIELTIGILAGSAPALRPLLRHISFFSYKDTQELPSQGYRSGKKGTGQSNSNVKMETFKSKSGTYSQLGRNSKDGGEVAEDGDSQEYILDGQDGKRKIEIRKDVSVQVKTTDGKDDWNPNQQYYY